MAGNGDFNGDGKTDILLRNDTGQLFAYMMNGAAIIGTGNVATQPAMTVVGPATTTATAAPISCCATTAPARFTST